MIRIKLTAIFLFFASASISMGAECGKYDKVSYEGKEYCLERDPNAAAAIAERNRLIGVLNALYLETIQATKTTQENISCERSALPDRAAQTSCLARLYFAKRHVQHFISEIRRLDAEGNALNLPANIKNAFDQKIKLVQSGQLKVLSAVDNSIKAAEKKLEESLTRSIEQKVVEWRNQGSNQAFCRLIQGETELASSSLLVARRAAREGDLYGIREASAKLTAAAAKARHGYKLCGLADDATMAKIEAYALDAKTILKELNITESLTKVCSDSRVQQWPKLRAECQIGSPSDELLYTIHTALVNKYSEEK